MAKDTQMMCADATEAVAGELSENSVDYFFSQLDDLNRLVKWFNKQGRTIIRKNMRVRRKVSSNSKSGFAVPVRTAKPLADFLGIDPKTEIPRTEVTKRLTSYIKDNNLQCDDNRKQFLCNEPLAKIFSVDIGTKTNWFEMQKFLAKLLTSVKNGTQDAALQEPPALAEAKSPEPNKKKIKKSV